MTLHGFSPPVQDCYAFYIVSCSLENGCNGILLLENQSFTTLNKGFKLHCEKIGGLTGL